MTIDLRNESFAIYLFRRGECFGTVGNHYVYKVGPIGVSSCSGKFQFTIFVGWIILVVPNIYTLVSITSSNSRLVQYYSVADCVDAYGKLWDADSIIVDWRSGFYDTSMTPCHSNICMCVSCRVALFLSISIVTKYGHDLDPNFCLVNHLAEQWALTHWPELKHAIIFMLLKCALECGLTATLTAILWMISKRTKRTMNLHDRLTYLPIDALSYYYSYRSEKGRYRYGRWDLPNIVQDTIWVKRNWPKLKLLFVRESVKAYSPGMNFEAPCSWGTHGIQGRPAPHLSTFVTPYNTPMISASATYPI